MSSLIKKIISQLIWNSVSEMSRQLAIPGQARHWSQELGFSHPGMKVE